MWHLSYYFSAAEINAISDGRAYGQTLLSAGGLPLGFGGVFFQPNGEGEALAVAFFYGGPNQIFVRKYIKLAVRGMGIVFRTMHEMGVQHVYMVADRRIEKSDTLARWLGGTPTGHEQGEGPLYIVPIANTPFVKE